MEYIDGLDLKRYIKENGPLSNDEAVRLMGEILLAMRMAHTRGIVHRDLKPQNVILTKKGVAKVTDFGIAVAFAETSLTQTNSMLGSVHYLSPEQARGSKATVQSDIYSMGIILFEMLTGRIPYDGDSAVTIALQHFQQPLPSVRDENPRVPQALENVVLRATAKKLADRYKTVAEMYTDLASALSQDRRHERKVQFAETKSDSKTLPKLSQITTEGKIIAAVTKKPQDKKTADNKSVSKPLKAKRKMRTRYKVLIAAVLLLMGAFATVLLSTPATIPVPDVVGETLVVAQEKIETSGLKVGEVTEEASSEVKEGTVLRTDPAANTSKREGSKINIVIAVAEAVVVPDVSGMTQEEAETELTTLGFEIGEVKTEKSSSVAEGLVIRTDPKGNSSKVKGSKVNIYVSSGVEMVTVPDVAGLSQSAAESNLKNAGFQVTITEQSSDTMEKGVAIGTDPAANTSQPKNSKISLIISNGIATEVVPVVTGLTENQARSAIEKAGFTVGEITKDYSSTVRAGSVISSDPAADDYARFWFSTSNLC